MPAPTEGITPDRLARLPPPRLPWVYLGAAHVGLAWAAAQAALRPELLTGFFYQPRTVALVHAITLGWITCSILGSLYLVGPIALRARVPASRRDSIACATVLLGASGMVAHFWIDRYEGMVWSAATLLAGLALAASSVLPPLLRGRVPVVPRAAVALAWINFLIAGVIGSLAGLEKMAILSLPGAPLTVVWAHAHLAALGWATMMVLGVGYRLLPMLLPAALPSGIAPAATVAGLQVGVAGLAAALIWWPPLTVPFAALCVLAIGGFVLLMAGRLRHLRPPPADLSRPDPAIATIALALLSLCVATMLGGWLLVTPPSATRLQLAGAYGVVGLLGFLGQLIAGVGMRLFPLAAWMRAYGAAGFVEPPVGPHALLHRGVQVLVTVAWGAAVPLLAAGVATAATAPVRGAAALLLLAAVAGGANLARAHRRVAAQPAAPDRVK